MRTSPDQFYCGIMSHTTQLIDGLFKERNKRTKRIHVGGTEAIIAFDPDDEGITPVVIVTRREIAGWQGNAAEARERAEIWKEIADTLEALSAKEPH